MKVWIFVIGIATLGGLLFLKIDKKAYKTTEIEIKHHKIKAKIADTNKKRTSGLMRVKYLNENEGMFFIFPTTNFHTFWMKNTLISLDMIWINKNYEIVHIEKDALPCKVIGCKIYTPKKPSKYVLEVNGGWVEKHDVKIGDSVITYPEY